MALSFGFYNSINSDRTYDAIQFGQIFDGIIKDGIYATYEKAMVVIASENAGEVIIQPGRAWFNHTWSYNDANYVIEAPAPDVLLERIDALVLDVNTELAFRENSFKWVEGTASSRPERPTLTNTVTHHQYPLCYVHRYPETTMIYTRDITNAVGTSECPFVTGVLEGLDIDMWINQWDDEFHTWENATRTQFEGWMINQQEVYTTWFNSVRSQMEDNMTEFEAWFETIQGIIDEEAATHLQAEIDALAEMLPAGSHIDIHTTESTLYNRNVTVSDQAGHSKTVKFGATGDATVESFPYVGLLDFVSTDGVRTASSSITTPYFGRYVVTMAFWAATCNLVSDESFAGIVVTVKDSLGDVKGAVTLDQYGSGVYTATYPDEYTFTLTYGGRTMEVSLAVTQETTYEVELHGGFRFDIWLETGRVSETFESLDEILADEPTLRQLFLVHDSVDYICNTFSESATSALADITKIFNTDLAAKWINLSDYALDHFYAVSGIKSIMDTADKYGYGEWALMPQVPTMTSNTAPFGVVSASSVYTSEYPAWKAFDGNNSTGWIANTNASPNVQQDGWIQYHFIEKTRIKKIEIVTISTIYTDSLTLLGSNDGVNFETIDTISDITITTESSLNFCYIDIHNNNEYLYYRAKVIQHHTTSPSGVIPAIRTIQFYAWAPKGNVPVMTSNTAPYGTASASSIASSNEDAWRAFDGSSSTQWASNTNSNDYIVYKFSNPIILKKAIGLLGAGTSESTVYQMTFKIQGSNDNSTWVDLTDAHVENVMARNADKTQWEVDSDTPYLYIKLYRTASTGSVKLRVYDLQFYGRELKVSVPIMTNNTAPYGVASASAQLSADTAPWKAFNGSVTNGGTDRWVPNAASGWIQYQFTSATTIKRVDIVPLQSDGATKAHHCTLKGSNNGANFVTLTTFDTVFYANNVLRVQQYDVPNNDAYLYYRLEVTNDSADGNVYLVSLQFYGPDYSEKEFEAGTTKKWLYDHGVEVETLTPNVISGGITPVNDGNQLYMEDVSTANHYPSFKAQINSSLYDLIRVKLGNIFYDGNSATNAGPYITTTLNGTTVMQKFLNGSTEFPYNVFANISSDTTSNIVAVVTFTASKFSVSEWWLE